MQYAIKPKSPSVESRSSKPEPWVQTFMASFFSECLDQKDCCTIYMSNPSAEENLKTKAPCAT